MKIEIFIYNYKMCDKPDCTVKKPRFGILTPTRCFYHKDDNMIELIGAKSLCITCKKVRASYNKPTEKIARYCGTCATNDMVDLKHKKCVTCKKVRASYNKIGEKPMYCSTCATDDMVDVAGTKCVKCNIKTPVFNKKGEPPIYCSDCKDDDMIDVKNKKCVKCNKKRPSFNKKGETIPSHCSDCKDSDMVDVVSKLCIKCHKTRPNFNKKGEKEALYCSGCKDDDMIDVKCKKCEICNIVQASYGLLGNPPTHCQSHRQKQQLRHPTKRCISCKKNQAIYGYSTHDHCETCKKDDMINIVERICISCGLPNIINKDNKCKDCDNHQIIRLRKQKEVKEYLDNKNYNYILYDKIIDGGSCVKYRPDFMFDCKTHYVIIEVDEHQHKGYSSDCELIRMKNINESIGTPTIFIRYNPDAYKSGKKNVNPPKVSRFKVLDEILNKAIKYDVYNQKILLSEYYLYYDNFERKNIQMQTITKID